MPKLFCGTPVHGAGQREGRFLQASAPADGDARCVAIQDLTARRFIPEVEIFSRQGKTLSRKPSRTAAAGRHRFGRKRSLERRLAARVRPHSAKIRDCGGDGIGGERAAIVGRQFQLFLTVNDGTGFQQHCRHCGVPQHQQLIVPVDAGISIEKLVAVADPSAAGCSVACIAGRVPADFFPTDGRMPGCRCGRRCHWKRKWSSRRNDR